MNIQLLWKHSRPLISNFVRYMHISYIEAQSSYQGTVFGVLWIPLSTLIFTGLLGMIFHNGGEMGPVHFFIYVLSGYVCWNFIASTISSSTSIIQGKLEFAVHSNLTLAGLFGKTLADRLFEFGLNLVLLMLAIAILSPGNFGLQFVLIVPFLGLLSITSLGVSYLVNLMTLYVPDLDKVVKTAVRFMFFATPIFWSGGQRHDVRGLLEKYNPAAYYLGMSRQTFGVEPVDVSTWGTAAAVTLAVALGAYVAFQLTRNVVRNIK